MTTAVDTRGRQYPKHIRVDTPTVTLVISALNEAENLPYLLPKIPPMVNEVLLVDGHSTDGTVSVAKAYRPDVRIICQEGKGKGDAIRCGIQHATGDIIVTIDADGSMDPEEIPLFVDVLCKGFDLVKGSRFMQGGTTNDMPLKRRLGNKLFIWLVNMLFNTSYTDLCYGYNAFKRNSIAGMNLLSNGFEIETELNIQAAKSGLRITEVASFEKARIHGQAKLNSLSDGWRILKTIFAERFTNNHMTDEAKYNLRASKTIFGEPLGNNDSRE
jgi:glycosyltransferase involved in cell wall biosynthesis